MNCSDVRSDVHSDVVSGDICIGGRCRSESRLVVFFVAVYSSVFFKFESNDIF